MLRLRELPAAALPAWPRTLRSVDFLDAHGEGVYHLVRVPDLAEAVATGGWLGLDVIAKGQRADGSGFAYFDTRAETGVTLEVRRTSCAGTASESDRY